MKTTKLRVAIYSRVSSKETKTKANGENQLGQLRVFEDAQGWNVTKEYIDHESGLKSDRPEFKNLLSGASRHEFDIVLFWALDRFSREGTKKTLAYLTMLENYNVGFRSFTEQYLDSTGIFKDAVIGIIPQWLIWNRYAVVIVSAQVWPEPKHKEKISPALPYQKQKKKKSGYLKKLIYHLGKLLFRLGCHRPL